MNTNISILIPSGLRVRLRHLARSNAITALFIVLAPVSVHAQYEFTSNADGATITKYTGPGGEVIIPEKIRGKPVISIGPHAFSYCRTVTRVAIPEGITGIGNSAFQGCGGLLHVSLPNTLSSLGAYAFSGCTSLEEIALPGSITHWPVVTFSNPSETLIGSWVFADCRNLKTVSLGDGLQAIPPYGFSGCTRLSAILIPDSVSIVGNGAFKDCHSMAEVVIPDTVVSLGAYAFQRCAGLTNIVVPGSITQWPVVTVRNGPWTPDPPPPVTGSWIFQDCTNLTTATLAFGVSNIPPYAFSGCLSLNAAVLPGSLVRIGEGAFADCDSLAGVIIPNSVTHLGPYAFDGCGNLTSITIPGSLTNWETHFSAAVGISDPVNIIIPSLISAWTFAWCTNLRTVVLQEGLPRIPAGAFFVCPALTSIVIPRSVTSLGNVPESNWPFEGVGEAAPIFDNCTNLGALYFEGNAPPLLSELFYGVPENARVYYLPGTTGWGATYGGCPTALWRPQMRTDPAGFGSASNQFGFTISWARDRVVAVEACTNLGHPIWSPVSTNTLTEGLSYFSDAESTNHPSRFYRVRPW